ncbi:tripartite tricarboxylate transporter substrate binding protein [Mesorhizobium sp. CN2-181]|uniref:Bug family tripartite tricarboxylate transporter substrate binding protein n=1 Tax=Mesorhizobium yinganensis TaxID=3157707 RepID=UPI0032B82652
MNLKLTTLALALTTVLAAPMAAHAEFPEKPITIIIQAAPGGSPDILARIIGKYMSERVGQPVIVENKPGGAGNIAAELVANAAPDGYTLLGTSDSLSINQTLFTDLPFHAETSFAPVIQAISAPQVLAVNEDIPANNLQEFLALAKSKPGEVSLASPAIGTTGQLGVLLLENITGIDVTPAVYKSAQPALTDVLGKHADGIIVTLAPALPHIKSGKLKALAVSPSERSAALPDVPTFVEQGVPEFNFTSWQGFVAPAGTPADVIAKLNTEINAVIADPAARAQLIEQAFEPVGGTPEELGEVIKSGITRWAEVIKANNIPPVN